MQFRSDYGDNIIVVIIGQPEVRFAVHRDLICKRSGYFKHMFTQGGLCANEQTIRFYHTDPSTFKLYEDWVYKQSTNLATPAHAVNEGTRNWSDDSPELRRMKTCSRLCALWYLADSIEDGACKHAVISTLIRENYWEVFNHDPQIYRKVYASRYAKSLQTWLVDSMLPFVTPEYLDQHLNEFPPAMAVDLFKAFAASTGTVSATSRPKEYNAEKYY